MSINRTPALAYALLFSAVLLLLSGCLPQSGIQTAVLPTGPAPAHYTVSICENVFSAVQNGSIDDSELIYLDKEKEVALKKTGVIINRDEDSNFWVMAEFKELEPDRNYTLRYELYSPQNELFHSESFSFSTAASEYTAWFMEELNPRNRKKLSTGIWTVKILVNNNLLSASEVSILSDTPGREVPLKEYRWQDFRFQYPGDCIIESDRDIVDETGKQFRMVELTISRKHRIGMFLYFSDSWTPPPETAGQPEAMTSLMMGLPIALKQAEPAGAEAVTLTIGAVELAGGFVLAPRFVVIKPDSDVFTSLECFHRTLPDRMFFGILFTQGFKGKGSDTPEYFRLIRDAYSIIRSITAQEPAAEEEQPVNTAPEPEATPGQ